MSPASLLKGLSRRRDERWLADIWQRQSFERRNLRTTSGLAFKVVFPGLCTGEAGPDFRDAILALDDGSLLRGDVELHLSSGGWRQHGHDRDPAYDRVLLHVVLEDDEPVRDSTGGHILTLELAGRLRPHRAPEPEPPAVCTRVADPPTTDQISYVVAPCQRVLPRKGIEAVRAAVTQLGLGRFEAKQAAFEGELAVFEAGQALYAGLMEALGYSRNRAPFRRLAQSVPLTALSGLCGAVQIERVLMAAAGLRQDGEQQASTGALPSEEASTGQALPPGSWHMVGVRPDNMPQRRIQQFAAVLAHLLPGGLLDELLAPLLELDACGPPRAVAQLRQAWHRQLSDVGPQRADAMAVNVLLPFAAAYGQATCQFMMSDLAVQAFLAYPAQGSNQITRYMRHDILGPLANGCKGAAAEQGLLQVWDCWCREKVCALCPLGSGSQPLARID